MVPDTLPHRRNGLGLIRAGLPRRFVRLALCGLMLGSVGGCVVAPVPARVGYYHPGVWVPAHWNGWRWVRGHWA